MRQSISTIQTLPTQSVENRIGFRQPRKFTIPMAAWDDSADNNLERVVVLSKEINERVFGGEDSVGRSVRMNGMDFQVVGVLDEFLPVPKAGVGDQSGGDRYMVNIHTDKVNWCAASREGALGYIETLKQDGTGAESEIEDRGHIPAETSRRMSCDCSIVHWYEDKQGDPLNIGRKTRSIPPAIRRALKRRDQGCCFPGCTCSNRFVDAHHIQHWADGGETSMANLVQICRIHHRLVHEAGYGVQVVAGEGIVFSLPNGNIIPGGPDTRSRGNILAIKSENRKNGLDINPGTCIPEWYGDQMDHGMAIDMLLQCE